MPSVISKVRAILESDPELMMTLPGGVHRKVEITRQNTPEAFDAFNQIIPCALITAGPTIPTGPTDYAALDVVSIYFYHPADFGPIQEQVDRVYTLLNRQQAVGVWLEARRVYDSPEIEDAALQCPMRETRYEITRFRG